MNTPKFDWNKPFRTRDGRKAELLRKLNDETNKQKYVCVVTNTDGKEHVQCYTEDGGFYTQIDTPHDLINIPEKRKMWVNVYDNTLIGWESKKEADASARPDRIACVEVEFEFTPGQGL